MKTFCFDLDGVICSNTFGNYAEAIPFQKAIDKINQLAEDGNKIIIFTSRFMGMNNEDINKANLQGFEMTYNQLKKWNVRFDKLILGKPTYDIMIDDKHFLYDDTWIDKLK